jgi:hypothetical protein
MSTNHSLFKQRCRRSRSQAVEQPAFAPHARIKGGASSRPRRSCWPETTANSVGGSSSQGIALAPTTLDPFVRMLCTYFSILGVLLASATTSWAASQIVVPGLESERIVETRVDGELLLLRTEEGRLYSIPVNSVEFQSLQASEEPTTPAILSVPDIVELLLSGVSEETVRAYIEASAPPNVRYDLTKADLIELKRAGASEAFIQYLIRLGRYGPMSTFVTWRSPEGPRREEPPEVEVQGYADEGTQGGIPYFPYVFPGCGTCGSYPYYPLRPVHPIYPGHPIHPGWGGGGTTTPDGTEGSRPGYYPNERRSLFRSSTSGNVKPTPLPSGRSSNGKAWLRWKGSAGQRGKATANGISSNLEATPSFRGTTRTSSSNSGQRAIGPSRSTMSTGSFSGRGQTQSRGRSSLSGSRSSGGSRRSMFGGKRK